MDGGLLEREWTRSELACVSADVLIEMVAELQQARRLDREYLREALTLLGRTQVMLAAVERERERALRELSTWRGLGVSE
jgi:predicted nucleic-acid-binding protein